MAQVSSPATDVAGLAAAAALAVVPLGFLVGLLRSRLARSAVGDLVIELGCQLGPGQLQGALARALGDPSLELVYRFPDAEDYVDIGGRRVELPTAGSRQAVTFTDRVVEKHVTSIFFKLQLPAAAEDHRRVLAVLTFLRTWGRIHSRMRIRFGRAASPAAG
jgi:hypothetical protein